MKFFKDLYERVKWALTPPSRKKRVLDEALKYLRGFPVMAGLIDLAGKQGVPISFDPALIGTNVGGQVVDNRRTGKRTLGLKPSYSAARTATTLVHELRHIWQKDVLGLAPGQTDSGDSDPRTSLLYTRVLEADAFAFANTMIRRMTTLDKLALSLMKAHADLAKIEGKPVATVAERLKAVDEVRAALPINPDSMKKELAENFRFFLKYLSPYDVKTLNRYHTCYTSPAYRPLSHKLPLGEKVLGLEDLRKITQGGNGVSYLGKIDDKTFVDTVLKDVSPEIIRTIGLMENFEKAAKKLPANDNLTLRRHIDRNVRAAESAEARAKELRMQKPRVPVLRAATAKI